MSGETLREAVVRFLGCLGYDEERDLWLADVQDVDALEAAVRAARLTLPQTPNQEMNHGDE